MDVYAVVKTIHIVSATLLFGTGLGTAFFFLNAHFSKSRAVRLFAAKTTIRADYLFTLPAVIVQPLSGLFLVYEGGMDPLNPWLLATYGLYLVAGCCWVPVVFIQLKMAKMLDSQASGETLDERRYRHLLNIWFLLGWPAFLALVAVFWLMVAKPGW